MMMFNSNNYCVLEVREEKTTGQLGQEPWKFITQNEGKH